MTSEDLNIEPGVTFVDKYGDEFTVESVDDAGRVDFEDYLMHWVGEIEGFVEDDLWRVKEDENGD